jgi:hypothetical protein
MFPLSHSEDLLAMDAKDHRDQPETENGICRLEWIAWAIEAARRHKESEQQRPDPPRRIAPSESDEE